MLRMELYKVFGHRKYYIPPLTQRVFWKEGNALNPKPNAVKLKLFTVKLEKYCTAADTVFRYPAIITRARIVL